MNKQPLVTVGVNWYREGVHLLPYTFGVRLPYANPTEQSWEGGYNAGFEHGAYEGAWRVGLAGLALGVGVGIVTMALLKR